MSSPDGSPRRSSRRSAASSSDVRLPTSDDDAPSPRPQRGGRATAPRMSALHTSDMSSPMNLPDSSPAGQPASAGSSAGGQLFGSTPLAPATLSSPLMQNFGRQSPRTELQGLNRRLASRAAESGVSFSATGSSPRVPGSDNDPMANAIIWGTTVHINATMEAFRSLLTNFTLPGEDMPYYLHQFELMHDTSTWHLNLDCQHLQQHPPSRGLYDQLVKYPQEVITLMDGVALDEFCRHLRITSREEARVQVRTFNLEKATNLRDLNPEDIDKLVRIKGLIIRTSPVIPDIKQGFFRCTMCDTKREVAVDRGRIEEPVRCDVCQGARTYVLVHNLSKFSDKQIVRLQETPDSVPNGQTPHTVTLMAYDDTVDVPRPGDRVEVTGIYRAMPVRPNPRQRAVRSVYRTYIDVLHYKMTDAKRVRATRADIDPDDTAAPLEGHKGDSEDLPAEVVERIQELSRDPDVYERLTRSLAPSIFEMEDVKKGVLCQLFGGTTKAFTKGGAGRFRGDINILLCGDPGTSKSQMLQYVHKIAPRGIYTSGKGSSAVGLTAYVTKDPETKLYVLESGALVLSDGGVCCIDEFDKMSDSARAILHEVMEQQTVSIAKAGIICTLNARTSILASANPLNSRYEPDKSVVHNVQLPPTLISRFDLLYIILDLPNQNHDRRLAQHILSLYQETPQVRADEGALPVEFLSQYISYARENCNPVLSDEAGRQLVANYVELRKLSGSRHVFTASPRSLEAMVRLAEARAKIRLSPEVDVSDVAEALRLYKAALKTFAVDPATGKLDLDLAYTGKAASARAMVPQIARMVRDYLSEGDRHTKTHNTAQLFQEFRKSGAAVPRTLDMDLFKDALRELAANNHVSTTNDMRTFTFAP